MKLEMVYQVHLLNLKIYSITGVDNYEIIKQLDIQ